MPDFPAANPNVRDRTAERVIKQDDAEHQRFLANLQLWYTLIAGVAGHMSYAPLATVSLLALGATVPTAFGAAVRLQRSHSANDALRAIGKDESYVRILDLPDLKASIMVGAQTFIVMFPETHDRPVEVVAAMERILEYVRDFNPAYDPKKVEIVCNSSMVRSWLASSSQDLGIVSERARSLDTDIRIQADAILSQMGSYHPDTSLMLSHENGTIGVSALVGAIIEIFASFKKRNQTDASSVSD